MDDANKVLIFNYAFDYFYGSLWWGRESLILEHIPDWQDSGRYSHSLLSLRKKPVSQIFEVIPMLAGTSGRGKLTVYLNDEEDKPTDFSSAACSVGITAEDFLWHSDEYNNQPETAISKRRRIWPVYPKKRISEEEKKRLDQFLNSRRFTALNNGGYNHE